MKKENEEILFSKWEMIKELRRKTNAEVVKDMSKWKTDDVRDIWNYMKKKEAEIIVKKIKEKLKK